MKLRLLMLFGGTLVLWILLAGPAFLLLGLQHLIYSAVAAGVCLVPAAATMLWCDLALGKAPEQQLAAVLGGTGIRMGFVIGVGMVLYFTVEEFHAIGFWLWIVVFYLATLTLEVSLVVRRQTALDRAAPPQNPV